ncbi:MAG TPA: hypothetical protein VNL77_21335 [Roseiflexaceae bacterium]|nr:hypothetical protein [Roseiflexaceae bacterium]
MRRILMLLALLSLAACGARGAPAAGGGAEQVIAAFRAAGLEAEGERAMTQADYGDAPFLCSGTQFSLPSLGEGKVGRVFICDRREELTSLKTYFNVRGQGNPELRSWTYSKDLVLVQLDGSMPRETAQKYEAALP